MSEASNTNIEPQPPEAASQATIGSLLEEVDLKVGDNPPAPNGTRYDEFNGLYQNRPVRIGIRQTPIEVSQAGETAFINIWNPGDPIGGDRTHFLFYPNGTGVELARFKWTGSINESARIIERKTGYATVYEDEANDLLAAIQASGESPERKRAMELLEGRKQATKKGSPKGFLGWLNR